MAWESPISIQVADVSREMIKEENKLILKAVNRLVVEPIDEQRLIDALKYDSKQYEVGYKDGFKKARNQIARQLITDYNGETWLKEVIDTVMRCSYIEVENND